VGGTKLLGFPNFFSKNASSGVCVIGGTKTKQLVGKIRQQNDRCFVKLKGVDVISQKIYGKKQTSH